VKLLNKILLAFFALTLIVLYGGWRFIHSEKFSRDISIRVSQVLTKKFGAKLNFTGVDFKLVPLSTTFKNVSLEKKDPNLVDMDLVAEELTVEFTYSSFMGSNLEIDEVYLNRGSFDLQIHKKSEEETDVQHLDPAKIFADYRKLLSQLPVSLNLISLKSIEARIDKNTFFVNELKLSPLKRQIRLRADLGDIELHTNLKSKPILKVDSLSALLFLNKDNWRVDYLEVKKGKNQFSLKGEIKNVNTWLILKSEGSISGSLEDILAEIPVLPKEILPMSANVSANFIANGRVLDPDLAINFNGNAISTNWIKLDKANGEIRKSKNLIIVDKFIGSKGSEKYQLKQKQTIFDINPMKFTNFHLKLRLTEAFSNTFLYYLRESLDTLKLKVSGDVDVKLDSTQAIIEINDRASVKEFRLVSSDGKKNILKNNGFELVKTKAIIHSDYSLTIDAQILAKQTAIKAKGKLGNNKIDIQISDSPVDLASIGPIAGIELKGGGNTQLHIFGPMDATRFDFVVDWKNFSLLNLNFGNAKARFSFLLKDLLINIDELNGVYNQTDYNAEGSLAFTNNKGMDLRVNFEKANFKDARQMLALIFDKIKIPVMPEFNFTSSVLLKGGYDVKDLVVDGSIKGNNFKFGEEEADKIFSRFTLSNNHLNFKQLKLTKARGQLMANVGVSLANNYIEINGAAQGFRLNDFSSYRKYNLEYDGDLFLDFDGNGTTNDFNSRFKLRLANAFIGNVPASSSNALFYVNSDDVVTNASLLGGKIKLDSLLKIKSGLATTKASIDATDIKEILGIISGHNISEKGISGRIKADLNTEINVNGEGVRKFYLNIAEFNLKKDTIDLKVDPNYNKIEVEDGNVRLWDLRLRDGDDYLYSKGRNISNGVIALDQRFSFKANLLEVATDYIDRAVGSIKGQNTIILEKEFKVRDFTLGANNLSMKVKSLPGFFNDIQLAVVKKGEVYELTKLTGKYGAGDIRVVGRVLFDDMYPQVSLDYKIDRATIPLFKKSNVLISSNGSVTGTDLPYRLVGKVYFLHGEFLDDPTDFTKEGKINIDEYKKYLPQSDLNGKKSILDMNLAFDITNPLVLKNNMAEVYIKGNGQATGDILSPELNTRLEIVPTLSKFKFKGHDFILNQGYVEIRDRGKNRLSDLKFTGSSRINDYDLKLDLSGNISKVNVDLSSEPALSKEDLLSLVTFGVTTDMSKNLESSERKFVTTVGIGTLLVDQLKINEDLNSTLGLKLSVQPEFKENESAIIQGGKAAISNSSSSRLKSATKVKLNKQVTNKIDVSISNTFGGSLEQKQEMNVNYNINKSFSIQGVYETSPSDNEETEVPNSVGADLKYRWSF
jgi:translocation and assembly module TamB